jgi:hypothetical protein
VLEQMKQQHALSTNGGIIVTYSNAVSTASIAAAAAEDAKV